MGLVLPIRRSSRPTLVASAETLAAMQAVSMALTGMTSEAQAAHAAAAISSHMDVLRSAVSPATLASLQRLASGERLDPAHVSALATFRDMVAAQGGMSPSLMIHIIGPERVEPRLLILGVC